MSHCVEIGCPDCGYAWCCRCYDDYTLSDDQKEEIKERNRVKAGDRCPNCGGTDTRII